MTRGSRRRDAYDSARKRNITNANPVFDVDALRMRDHEVRYVTIVCTCIMYVYGVV